MFISLQFWCFVKNKTIVTISKANDNHTWFISLGGEENSRLSAEDLCAGLADRCIFLGGDDLAGDLIGDA